MTQPVICFDLDGTLIDEQGCIHPKDGALLQTPNLPVHLIPATGRSLDAVHRTFRKNGLFLDRPLPFPIILLNGALIYRAGEIMTSYVPFDPEIQQRLVQLTDSYEKVTFLFLDKETVYLRWPTPFGDKCAQKYEFISRPFNSEDEPTRYGKMMALSEDKRTLVQVASAVKPLGANAEFSLPVILEIYPLGINKASSLKFLIGELGLQDATVFAAGDGHNDVELLKAAHRSFTPVTSPISIQRVADQVVDTAEEGLLTPILRTMGFDTLVG